MSNLRNARDVRNGWGVCGQYDVTKGAAALAFLGTRWVRREAMIGSTSTIGFFKGLAQALVAGNYFDPNLKAQCILNDYLQDSTTWTQQQATILNDFIPTRNPNGTSILACIEGPNEMNSGDGGGAHGVGNTTDMTGGQNVTSDNTTADANFLAWANALNTFKLNNSTALSGVEIISPTLLYFFAPWTGNQNVSGKVDYGTFHYYAGIGGTTGVPSYPPDPDNFAAYYAAASAAITSGGSMVQSEGGASMQTGGGYAQDGRSQARYMLMQLLDHFAVGGHRWMIYELFDGNTGSSNNEENFGLYNSDLVTPKPSAIALHNFSNLMSLNNNYNDPANLTDTASFTPAYDGSSLSVTGLANAGAAGSTLVLAKSDGTTNICVWNEPPIDDGNGTSLSPAANNISVNFGSTQTYKVYDPTGGGNVANFTASTNLNPIASGTGTSVSLTLYGNPLVIQIGTSKSASNPVTPTGPKAVASASGTTITTAAGSAIVDTAGNVWTLVLSASLGMQIAVNGVVDTTTSEVLKVSYINGVIYQMNINNNWYSTTSPAVAWVATTAPVTASPTVPIAPTAPTGPIAPTAPTKPAASASGTIITKTTDSPIVDSSGNLWSLVNGSNGMSIAINGITDTTTCLVVELAYVKGIIWQKNSVGNWYSKTSATSAWSAGTKTSPIAPAIKTSASGTIISPPSTKIVYDAVGNAYILVNSATSGYQISVNGVRQTTTANVVKLGYLNGWMYHQNKIGEWYGKAQLSDGWTLQPKSFIFK